MNEFDFSDDKNVEVKFIKKLGIIFFIFIIVFFIIRSCNNYLTNKFRDDLKHDKNNANEEMVNEKIDLNSSFNSYNITSNEDLYKIIKLVSIYLEPVELQKYVNYDLYSYKDKWNTYNSFAEFLMPLKKTTYSNFFNLLIHNKVDYNEAPLTTHFKNKFDDSQSILSEYGYNDEGISMDLDKFDYENNFFVISKTYEDNLAEDYYYFNFVLDEKGYLDDIVFDKIEQEYDKLGQYINKKDSILLTNEKDIELILWLILGNDALYTFDGNAFYYYWQDPYSRYNLLQQIGLSDSFRKHFESLNGKGILPIKFKNNYDRLKIDDINIETKTAIAIVDLQDSDTIRYYNITWDIDEYFRLDSITTNFIREEEK